MTTITFGGLAVAVNDEGYLTDREQWNEEVAAQIAETEGITLTNEHFDVLHYLRDRHAQGENITIRSVGKSGVTTIKDFYRLFPGAPLKKASKIAGIPKPVSCI